jgi:type IV secretory pathway TrbL component
MDRSLRQIVMLGKVTGIALTATPIFLLLSVLLARQDQSPASVERVAPAPQASAADANSTTPRLKVDITTTQVLPAEMLRPELTLSLLNFKRSATTSITVDDAAVSFFASSPSENASDAAKTIPGMERAAQIFAKPATTIADVAPTESQPSVTPSEPPSTDTPSRADSEENTSAETASSADLSYEPAWPDQWLTRRSTARQKQNTTAKLDKSKRHSLNVRMAQKEKKPSASATKKDVRHDDQSESVPIGQPNIEDVSD